MTAAETLSKRSLVSDRILNPSFWDEYAVLWHNSKGKSPFQAPEILKFFSGKFINGIVVFRLVSDQRLIAAVMLKQVNGVYAFLSDLKTDANFFVFHKECSDVDIEFFFTGFFDIIKKQDWAVMLNDVASWADYMPVFEKCRVKSNLFFQAINYSVCPVVKCDTAKEIRNIISRTSSLRNNANNFKRKLNAEFEVLTDEEDLQNWVQEFCVSHILRWEKTSTPSVFRNTARQLFLLKCLRAWCADKILVRFAIKVNGQRIGFIVGLVEENSLICHSLTYHPGYHKLSPAKVLLLTMAEWMLEKSLNILDFGNGNEKYKYSFANQELVLQRVFISRRTNYSFIARAKLIKLIKSNSRVYSFYQKKIKRFLIPNRDAKIKAGNT